MYSDGKSRDTVSSRDSTFTVLVVRVSVLISSVTVLVSCLVETFTKTLNDFADKCLLDCSLNILLLKQKSVALLIVQLYDTDLKNK
jgi:hypothetical protein